MEQSNKSTSKFLNQTVLDLKDELDERLERCHATVVGLTANSSEREANNALQAFVGKGPMQHEEVQLGLYYVVLTEPQNAAKSYRDLAFVSRDSLSKVILLTNQFVYERWTRLQDSIKTQVVWFTKELVKNGVPGADSICHSLIRQIAGGDISPKNIWLTEAVLDIFIENRSWLDKYPVLLPIAVYTYLRVIVDHGGQPFANLRQKEVEFCVAALREKFSECMVIGRDLVRLLQFVARIPEFESIWQDMLHNPSALHSTFTGVHQLLQMRTSKRYFISRLTPDMENKLVFLTAKVKFGQHKRYQDWFQRQYLATAESQSLRCDLIRYICAVIHPSNEVLCSDIIPRWAVIGWLLTTCTSNVAASNAKLSLFYDWLCFDKEKDSIMNIEPCILVMYHSMRPHPAITATLLDFMCRIMTNFYPPLFPQIKQGIFTSLHTIVEKKVLPSLAPLFDNTKLDRELRIMLREHYSEFCSADVKEEPGGGNNNSNSTPMPDMIGGMDPNLNHLSDNNSFADIAEFSEDEDDIPLGKLRTTTEKVVPNEMKFMPIKEPPKFEAIDITEFVNELDGRIKDCVLDLMQSDGDNEVLCELMDRLMQAIIREDEFDGEVASVLAMCLCQILISQFNNNIFPELVDEESLEDSLGTPLFVIFRNISQMQEEDPSRHPLLLLLEEMYGKQARIGYHLLYFLKVSQVQCENKMAVYKDFCKYMDKALETLLMRDLQLCQEDDVRLFTYLIPDIYTQFPNIAIGNADILHLIVSCIDGTQLQDLICEILRGHLVMFRKDSFIPILNASLEWETIEQYFLWQLIATHNIPVEHITPILPKLEFSSHAEALTSIMIQLKQEVPTSDLLRTILYRECKKTDLFTVSVLKYWAQEYEDKLADLIHAQLTRNNSTPSRKRQRQQQISNKGKEKEQPSTEQVLAHLEHMRQTCRNVSFLMHESMQQALQHAQTVCTDTQKARFSDLLALVEDFEEMRSTRVLRAVPSRRASAAATATGSRNNNRGRKSAGIDDSDTTESSTDEDEIIRPPKSKKPRKTTSLVEDDD